MCYCISGNNIISCQIRPLTSSEYIKLGLLDFNQRNVTIKVKKIQDVSLFAVTCVGHSQEQGTNLFRHYKLQAKLYDFYAIKIDVNNETIDTFICLCFRASLICFNNCPTRCNIKQSIYYSASSLYMFRVSATPIIRSTQNCNYSLRYCAATSLQSGQVNLATLEAGSCTKNMKRTCRIINRLICVASRWTIINIYHRHCPVYNNHSGYRLCLLNSYIINSLLFYAA